MKQLTAVRAKLEKRESSDCISLKLFNSAVKIVAWAEYPTNARGDALSLRQRERERAHVESTSI